MMTRMNYRVMVNNKEYSSIYIPNIDQVIDQGNFLVFMRDEELVASVRNNYIRYVISELFEKYFGDIS